MRDRLHDLDDLANRLLHKLTGQSLVVDRASMPENAILVARTMGPAALLEYDRARLRGLVLEEAGASSHVAIVARALAIPAVGDIPNISEIVEHRRRHHRRRRHLARSIYGRLRTSRRPTPKRRACAPGGRRSIATLRDAPAISRDGVSIGLHMNAGLLVDMPHLAETGAESIGLFRTELQFMLASRFPRPQAQQQTYRAILEAAGDGRSPSAPSTSAATSSCLT